MFGSGPRLDQLDQDHEPALGRGYLAGAAAFTLVVNVTKYLAKILTLGRLYELKIYFGLKYRVT